MFSALTDHRVLIVNLPDLDHLFVSLDETMPVFLVLPALEPGWRQIFWKILTQKRRETKLAQIFRVARVGLAFARRLQMWPLFSATLASPRPGSPLRIFEVFLVFVVLSVLASFAWFEPALQFSSTFRLLSAFFLLLGAAIFLIFPAQSSISSLALITLALPNVRIFSAVFLALLLLRASASRYVQLPFALFWCESPLLF